MFELQISVVPIWAKTTCMHAWIQWNSGHFIVFPNALEKPHRRQKRFQLPEGFLFSLWISKITQPPAPPPPPLHFPSPSPSPPPLPLPSPSPPSPPPLPFPPLHLPSPSPSLHPYYPLRLRQPMNCTLYLRSVGFILFQVEWERMGK